MNDILFGSALSMADKMARGDISAVELLHLHFDRIDRLNPAINAIIWQDREAALAEARTCDAERASGRVRGHLHGVPVTVKESFDLAGSPTTWGYPDWRENIAVQDSDVVRRYRNAGAIVFGKTNVPTGLGGWQTFNEIYGETSNPWDLERSPGGSSGGSAAALAAGFSALEAGSDNGASIRAPAHYCGVFGLKPTWNAVSMRGHLPPGWLGDFDIGAGGPMARSAADLALAFDILEGPGRFDRQVRDYRSPADDRVRLSEFKVAVKLSDPVSPLDNAYAGSLARFAATLAEAGAKVIHDRQPEIESETHFLMYLKLLGASLSFGMTEQAANDLLALFADETDPGLRVGRNRYSSTNLSHRDWLKLDNDRRQARVAFDRLFDEVDILLMPVFATAAVPRKAGGQQYLRRMEINGTSQIETLQLFWAGYSGVVGLPSVVGPMDRIDGLPVGYQAVAGHGRDRTALAFARAVEREIAGFVAPPRMCS